jgi:hypothetical protein
MDSTGGVVSIPTRALSPLAFIFNGLEAINFGLSPLLYTASPFMANRLVNHDTHADDGADFDEVKLDVAIKTMRVEAAAFEHRSPYRPRDLRLEINR